MNAARIGLLTGPVGVGKTTVAERVVTLAQQGGLTCGGLLAPALLNPGGQKAGIWGVAVRGGERRLLARIDEELGGPQVGPYSFNAAVLAWALSTVERDSGVCDLLIVDEIGKMELRQGAGLAPVLPRLAAGSVPRSLVLVRENLLEELQSRLGAIPQIAFAVSQGNRDRMPHQILEELM